MEVVGDGDFFHAGFGEGVDGERLGWGVFARPKDEDAVGVGGWGGAGEARGEVGGDEFFGVNEVGGEEEVSGGAVFDLLGDGG